MLWLFGMLYMPERRWLVTALKAEGDLRPAGLKGDTNGLWILWIALMIFSGATVYRTGTALPWMIIGMIFACFVIMGLARWPEVGDPILVFYDPRAPRWNTLFNVGLFVANCASRSRFETIRDSGLPGTEGLRWYKA